MLLKYEYGAEYEEEKDEFLNIRIPSGMFTFVVGTVPVHLRVDTRIGKATEFSVAGCVSASAGINLGSEISIGAEFTPENGLQPVNSIKNNNTLHTPELEISASASAKVSYYPHIDIKFYNLIGPWFEARPYLSEDISAGMTLSADGSRDLGWKSLTSAGLDLHMGLFVKFLNASLNFPLEPMNLFDATIFEAPKKITRISPAQGTTIRKGQMIDATFKAESYSPLTKKYYPCPGALIYFDTNDGTYSPKASIANVSGLATTRWTPKPNTVTKATTEHNLTASIIDHDGEAIDETTLTVSFEEAEQWVDLGLSVLWSGWNLGADSPEEYGGYYAWGETTEKNSFTWENYRYAEQFWCVEYGEEGKEYRWPEWIGTFIGSNISGTAYDAAHVQWGDGARMPTYGEIIELMLSCDFNYGTYNGVEGNYVTGPNGNSIFLPFAGDYFVDSDGRGSYNMGSFWSGTYDDGNRNRAIGFTCDDKGNIQDYFSFRGSGQSIRPVRNLDGSDKPADEGPEVDGYDPEDNPFYEYGDNGGGESGGGSGSEDSEGLWVDLGLSVKWAAWNVGASSPEEPGGYYAWGETEEKPTYTWDNYIFTDPDTFVFDFIGEEISGTMYDVAHVKWGNGARMPTRAEMQELIDNCTFELVEAYNDIPGARGLQITGPNGNRIFLPNGGLFMDDLLYVEEQVNIWSGTFSDLVHDGALENSYAYSLFYDSFAQPWERERYRLEGLNVRPVKD